jgi:hypothetical protein
MKRQLGMLVAGSDRPIENLTISQHMRLYVKVERDLYEHST